MTGIKCVKGYTPNINLGDVIQIDNRQYLILPGEFKQLNYVCDAPDHIATMSGQYLEFKPFVKGEK